MINTTKRPSNPVLYEARYLTLTGNVSFPVLDDNGKYPSFRDAYDAQRFGFKYAPLHCHVEVWSLRYSDASGCYERF